MLILYYHNTDSLLRSAYEASSLLTNSDLGFLFLSQEIQQFFPSIQPKMSNEAHMLHNNNQKIYFKLN